MFVLVGSTHVVFDRSLENFLDDHTSIIYRYKIERVSEGCTLPPSIGQPPHLWAVARNLCVSKAFLFDMDT